MRNKNFRAAVIITMEGFQVDVILNSLRELQKEKSQNERVLAEEYAKRKQAEAQLEATSTKLVAISDKHNKLKETLQIAELKVAQTHAQAKMFEELNCERRDKIAGLNTQIEQKNIERQGHTEIFESEMTLLTEKFRVTWQTQSDNAMALKQAHNQREIGEYRARIEVNKLKCDEITRQLEEITLKQNGTKSLAALGGIPEETWASTIAILSNEQQSKKESLKEKAYKDQELIAQLRQEKAKLVDILESMQSQEQHNEE